MKTVPFARGCGRTHARVAGLGIATLFLTIASAQTPQQGLPVPTHEGLSYGADADQKLDLWLADSSKPTPLAVFFHGGGFRGGSRKGGFGAADVRYFLSQGISFASVDYRLTGVGPYPLQMHDSARAVQWLRANATRYNLDKSRFAAYGGSAGACISLWLAFHDDTAKPGSSDPVERESTRLVCAGSMNGQSTLDPRTFCKWFGVSRLVEHPALHPLFGIRAYAEVEKPEISSLVEDASPITHLSKGDPPVFMQYGGPDVPVTETTDANTWVHHPRLGIKLKEAMDKLGIECHVMYRDGPREAEYRNVQEFLAKKLLAG